MNKINPGVLNPYRRVPLPIATDRDSLRPGTWEEYERRKNDLPVLSPSDYQESIKRICEDLNI